MASWEPTRTKKLQSITQQTTKLRITSRSMKDGGVFVDGVFGFWIEKGLVQSIYRRIIKVYIEDDGCTYLEVPAPSSCCRSKGGSKICSRSSFDNSRSANWSSSDAIVLGFGCDGLSYVYIMYYILYIIAVLRI